MKIVTKENQEGVEIFYHISKKDAKGNALKVRRTGKTTAWQRDPKKFSIPVKYGLREYGYITTSNAEEWSITDPEYLVLTTPQWRIYARLMKGEKVTNIHTHRQSGGEFVWVKTYNDVPDYEKTTYSHEPVGYRAFWNLMRALKKNNDASEFFYTFDNERSSK